MPPGKGFKRKTLKHGMQRLRCIAINAPLIVSIKIESFAGTV